MTCDDLCLFMLPLRYILWSFCSSLGIIGSLAVTSVYCHGSDSLLIGIYLTLLSRVRHFCSLAFASLYCRGSDILAHWLVPHFIVSGQTLWLIGSCLTLLSRVRHYRSLAEIGLLFCVVLFVGNRVYYIVMVIVKYILY